MSCFPAKIQETLSKTTAAASEDKQEQDSKNTVLATEEPPKRKKKKSPAQIRRDRARKKEWLRKRRAKANSRVNRQPISKEQDATQTPNQKVLEGPSAVDMRGSPETLHLDC